MSQPLLAGGAGGGTGSRSHLSETPLPSPMWYKTAEAEPKYSEEAEAAAKAYEEEADSELDRGWCARAPSSPPAEQPTSRVAHHPSCPRR